MGAMASQIASFTIVYSTVYSDADQRKIKAPRHWPLCGEFTGDWWIHRTNGQKHGKFFLLMTSSWYNRRWTSRLASIANSEIITLLANLPLRSIILHISTHPGLVPHTRACFRSFISFGGRLLDGRQYLRPANASYPLPIFSLILAPRPAVICYYLIHWIIGFAKYTTGHVSCDASNIWNLNGLCLECFNSSNLTEVYS